MKLKLFFFLTGLALVVLVGCGGKDEMSEGDIQATVDAAVQATTIALAPPTFTPVPTVTPNPTVTEVPGTATPTPTATPTSTPTPTPTPELPFYKNDQEDGTSEYFLPFDGFSMRLPSDWVVIDTTLTTDTPEQQEIQNVLGSRVFQGLIDTGVKFYAINWSEPSRTSASPANINITTQPAEGATSLDGFGTAAVDQLVFQFDLLREDIGLTPTSIGENPAVRLDYFWNLTTPTGLEANLQVVQHITISDDQIFIITITIPSELSATLLPEAEAAVQQMSFFERIISSEE